MRQVFGKAKRFCVSRVPGRVELEEDVVTGLAFALA
jgi:hypothetical protein